MKEKEAEVDQDASIYTVVLSGGPCAGKSTALAKLTEHLTLHGFKVYTIPEIPTLFLSAGAMYRNTTLNQLFQFEDSILKAQIMLEDSFYEIAKSMNKKCVIIMDRGTMDIAAYLPKDLWQSLLDENRESNVSLRDKRYNSVIHLTTAALGAEKFYTTQNNVVRTETIEEARVLDSLVLNTWIGHKNLFIIDNSTNFEGKIQRVIDAISRVIGIPLPEAEKTFEIKKIGDISSVKTETFEQEETSVTLENSGQVASLIKRGQNGSFTYSVNITRSEDGKIANTSRILTAREFVSLKQSSKENLPTVFKNVTFFTFKNNYYRIEDVDGEKLLRIQLLDSKSKFEVPEFLIIGNEIENK